MNALEIHNMNFSYDENILLNDVNLNIIQGQCVALTGKSGCGKSTLCYIMSGIIPRNIDGKLSGEVRIFGQDISKFALCDLTKNIGIVFQNPDSQLFSPTVEDEIAFGPENMKLSREEIKQRIDYALDITNCQELRFSNPSKLSGGQKQLISLAAVLALKPKILVFDEAMSQLDDEATDNIKNVIRELKSQNYTIIIVEHDADNLDIADVIYKVENHCLVKE